MIIALDLKQVSHHKIEQELDEKGLILTYLALSLGNDYCIIDIVSSTDYSDVLENLWVESEREGYSNALSRIQTALQYPPSIALAFCRAEVTPSSNLSLSRFVQAFAKDVTEQLDNVEKDGFHLRKVIQSDDFELRLHEYYWVKVVNHEKCLWVSLDYQLYETSRHNFLGL